MKVVRSLERLSLIVTDMQDIEEGERVCSYHGFSNVTSHSFTIKRTTIKIHNHGSRRSMSWRKLLSFRPCVAHNHPHPTFVKRALSNRNAAMALAGAPYQNDFVRVAHLRGDTGDADGAISRTKARRNLFPEGEPLDPLFSEAGSCCHLKSVLCFPDDLSLIQALEKDMVAAKNKDTGGEALAPHRSGKHFQLWGENLMWSVPYTGIVTRLLDIFDVTLVDSWVNLYRDGVDTKSWHHDNYQDRSPRPALTFGVSLGCTRDFGFLHVPSGKKWQVPLENGDVFAFDEPFNRVWQHSVVPMSRSKAPSLRIAVIIWANEQEHIPRLIRSKVHGQRDDVPLEVCWDEWDTMGLGSLSKRDRDRAKLCKAKLIAASVKEEEGTVEATGRISWPGSDALYEWLLRVDEHLLLYAEAFERSGLHSSEQVLEKHAPNGQLDPLLLDNLGVTKLGHRRLLQRWCKDNYVAVQPRAQNQGYLCKM